MKYEDAIAATGPALGATYTLARIVYDYEKTGRPFVVAVGTYADPELARVEGVREFGDFGHFVIFETRCVYDNRQRGQRQPFDDIPDLISLRVPPK